jgi:hypothetical protein
MMRTDVEDKRDQLKFVKFNDLEENFPAQSFHNFYCQKDDIHHFETFKTDTNYPRKIFIPAFIEEFP